MIAAPPRSQRAQRLAELGHRHRNDPERLVRVDPELTIHPAVNGANGLPVVIVPLFGALHDHAYFRTIWWALRGRLNGPARRR
jgi:hypothetical protein